MIEIKNVCKRFGDIQSVDHVSLEIKGASVFGLLGTNGAGKSTLLRMMAGVLPADSGSITIDGESIWDNPAAKEKIFYISDEQYYLGNSTPKELEKFYSHYYPNFDGKEFRRFLKKFNLDANRKVGTFSKGMKKQLSILLGICAKTPYLFCDETFDGLDPVMRQGIKAIFAREMDERGLCPIIASHNLRELEDICDHIGLLHQGGVLLSEDVDDLKTNLHKAQFVVDASCDEEIKARLKTLSYQRRGKLVTMIARGEGQRIDQAIEEYEPVFYEALPLSLEEIFISETEVVGYDFKNLID